MADAQLSNLGRALFLNGYNISSNQLTGDLTLGRRPLEKLNWNQTQKHYTFGLKHSNFSGGGQIDVGNNSIDDILRAAFPNSDGNVVTVLPQSLAVNTPSYTLKGVLEAQSFAQELQRGQLSPYALDIMASSFFRGRALQYATAMTATTQSATQTKPAVSASQSIYAALHVFAVPGSYTDETLDVTIQSDADDTWPAGATTRITFSQVSSAVGVQYATPIKGAITDTHWRANATIAGTAPSYGFLVTFGIA